VKTRFTDSFTDKRWACDTLLLTSPSWCHLGSTRSRASKDNARWHR